MKRTVLRRISCVETSDGDGSCWSRRGIGNFEFPYLDPFVMHDEFCIKTPAGYTAHPHRGFVSVTYMLQGRITHQDFCGNKETVGPGGLQIMTAGRGIVHSEMPGTSEDNIGLNLWVNLRRKKKMCVPKFQKIHGDDVPRICKNGVGVSVLFGEALGVKSKLKTDPPTTYLELKLDAGARHRQIIPKGWNAFIYILNGSVFIANTEITRHETAVFSDGVYVELENRREETSHFVLAAGEPINELMVHDGQFVMNTKAEISQAILDFESGVNGFENAISSRQTWYSG